MGAIKKYPRGSVREDSFNRMRKYVPQMFERSSYYEFTAGDVYHIRRGNSRIARNGFYLIFFKDKKS